MRLAAFLLLTTIFLAGCNGGTVDLHALSNDSASIPRNGLNESASPV